MRARRDASPPSGRRASRTLLFRLALAFALPASLMAAIAGGLVRAGVALPAGGAWLSQAVVAHAFLMICTFMGTLIAIERAVAVRHPLCFVGPLASAGAGIAWLCGAQTVASCLVVAASSAFIAVNAVIVGRQRAAHTVLLLVGAVCWWVGSVLHLLALPAPIPWWFAFLVLTITAERLEMTRLMRRREGVAESLYAALASLVAGAALASFSETWGGVLYGLSLVALAAWLFSFDIARRTVRAHGLSRYMAVCLLLGYAWLCVAGLAWAASALGWPMRDAALHALGLGFVFGMVFAHAPVILPAIARVKVQFGNAWYAPLALLQASLALRLLGGLQVPRWLATGALCNALAIAAFAATVAASALAWHFRHAAPPRKTNHDAAH